LFSRAALRRCQGQAVISVNYCLGQRSFRNLSAGVRGFQQRAFFASSEQAPGDINVA